MSDSWLAVYAVAAAIVGGTIQYTRGELPLNLPGQGGLSERSGLPGLSGRPPAAATPAPTGGAPPRSLSSARRIEGIDLRGERMTPEDTIPKSFVYTFPAVIDQWHDGDTCYVHRGASPGVVVHGEHVRVQGINAPELSAAGGATSRDYANSLAPPGTLVRLTATKPDKYGRFLARITLPDGSDFSELMIAAGQAVAYLT